MTTDYSPIDFSQEDTPPRDDLGGSAIERFDAPDPDTGPEALAALDAAEARFGAMVESTQIPEVRWSPDADHPDYRHSHHSAVDSLMIDEEVRFTKEVFDLIVRANRYDPKGTNGMICIGLRGAELIGDDAQEGQQGFRIRDVRPDHVRFRCTLGFVDTQSSTVSAYRGSTVPNQKWMRNYFKLQNGIHTDNTTRSNLLPTGCYIYRVNAHSGGKIRPALRMTNPSALTEDAKCTVLRTSNDLAYAHDDLWDPSTPYDNIHCAYSDHAFSSAGCQTVKGANGKGAWGKFQAVIGALGWDKRIDYLLVTGREVAIAAAILAAGRQGDAAFVDACLGRLRVGSVGDEVLALQKKLGFNGTSYFGPLTKKRLTEREAAHGLVTDGIFAPGDDLALGWSVFATAGTAFDSPAAPRVSGQDGVGAADTAAVASSIVFRAPAGARSVDIATDVTLVHGGQDIPLRVTARIDGIPAAGPNVELVLRPVETTPPAAQPRPAAPDTPPSGETVAISAADFDAYAPRARADYRTTMVTEGAAVLAAHGINATPRRLAHFMAQLHHESGGFRLHEENLSYSAERLMQVWPSRFPSLAVAQEVARSPEKLANAVYGGRLGNTQPGDGFRYRGRGMIQLTGRSNYRAFSRHLGLDLEGDPDLAFDGGVALRIAAAYWTHRKLKGERTMNALADDDKLRAITYRINGGFNGFTHREAALDAAKVIWGDVTTGAAPVIVDRGDAGDDVRRLQILLIEQNVLGGRADGKFGKGTYDGLATFKSRHRMSGVGYADAATFAKLRSARGGVATESIGVLPQTGSDPEPIRPVGAYAAWPSQTWVDPSGG